MEYEPDPGRRDTEQIPLLEDGGVAAFLNREVLPYAPDARHNPATVKSTTKSASTTASTGPGLWRTFVLV